jgi:hypothetical protein
MPASIAPFAARARPALLAMLACTIGFAAPAQDKLPPEIEMVAAVAGDVLAVDDLCGWTLAPKVEAALRAAAKQLKLPDAQQRIVRAQIADIRKAKFGGLSPSARARTQGEICTPEQRAYLDKLIGSLSFD